MGTLSQTRGRLGEQCAAEYLLEKGACILGRNYRCPYGELDLIAGQGELLLFVEVKARRTGTPDAPAVAVGRAKRQKIVLSAQHYLLAHPELEKRQPRFDICEVLLSCGGKQAQVVRYLSSAFTLDDL